MHDRAIICSMCGGKFFPASLPFHQKACARKNAAVLVPCPYCKVEIAKGDVEAHCKRCPPAMAAMKKKRAEAIAAGGGDFDDRPVNGGGGGGGFKTGGGGFNVNEFLGVDSQGLMPCSYCGRKFAQDRISKHEGICANVKNKVGAPKQVFDSFQQRQVDPLVLPVSAEDIAMDKMQSKQLHKGANKASRQPKGSRMMAANPPPSRGTPSRGGAGGMASNYHAGVGPSPALRSPPGRSSIASPRPSPNARSTMSPSNPLRSSPQLTRPASGFGAPPSPQPRGVTPTGGGRQVGRSSVNRLQGGGLGESSADPAFYEPDSYEGGGYNPPAPLGSNPGSRRGSNANLPTIRSPGSAGGPGFGGGGGYERSQPAYDRYGGSSAYDSPPPRSAMGGVGGGLRAGMNNSSTASPSLTRFTPGGGGPVKPTGRFGTATGGAFGSPNRDQLASPYSSGGPSSVPRMPQVGSTSGLMGSSRGFATPDRPKSTFGSGARFRDGGMSAGGGGGTGNHSSYDNPLVTDGRMAVPHADLRGSPGRGGVSRGGGGGGVSTGNHSSYDNPLASSPYQHMMR